MKDFDLFSPPKNFKEFVVWIEKRDEHLEECERLLLGKLPKKGPFVTRRTDSFLIKIIFFIMFVMLIVSGLTLIH